MMTRLAILAVKNFVIFLILCNTLHTSCATGTVFCPRPAAQLQMLHLEGPSNRSRPGSSSPRIASFRKFATLHKPKSRSKVTGWVSRCWTNPLRDANAAVALVRESACCGDRRLRHSMHWPGAHPVKSSGEAMDNHSSNDMVEDVRYPRIDWTTTSDRRNAWLLEREQGLFSR
jgi:hypothetical protein